MSNSDPEATGRRDPSPTQHSADVNLQDEVVAQRRDTTQRVRRQFQVAADVSRNPITFKHKSIDYNREIRVLKIYPGTSAELECRLVPCALQEPTNPVQYTALSYYWGKDIANHKVYMYDDDEMQRNLARLGPTARASMRSRVSFTYIQDNLNKALRQLRSPDESVFVWTDALCIHQKNTEEKTAQVANMHEVYMQASNVCIWLGDAKGREEENRQTFEFLNNILDLQQLEKYVGRLQERDEKALADWRGVIRLMGSDWFKRRWVIQELALAAVADVRCGDCTMPWLDFADAIALLMTKQSDIRRIQEPTRTYQASRDDENNIMEVWDPKAQGANALVAATSNLFRKSNEGQIQQRLLSLERLVSCWLLAFEASDPKDTIFSVLQIAKDTSGRQVFEEQADANTLTWKSWTLRACFFALATWITFKLEGHTTLRAVKIASTTDTFRLEASLIGTARQTVIPWLIRVVYFLIISLIGICVELLLRPFLSSINSQPAKFLDKRLQPNYEKPIVDVYGDFIEYCVETSNSLDVLCRHWAPKAIKSKEGQEDSMPSWILPISGHAFGAPKKLLNTRVNGDSLVGGSEVRPCYKASGSLPPSYYFGKNRIIPEVPKKYPIVRSEYAVQAQLQELPQRFDGALDVRGFPLGKVEESAQILSHMISQQALEILGWPANKAIPSNIDQVWRTLVANRGPGGTNPPTWYRRVCQSCLEWYDQQRVDHFNTDRLKKLVGTPPAKVEFLERVQQVVWGRKCFRSTLKGQQPLVGLAPRDTQAGDLVCILFGCSVPVVLRKLDRDFKFIGECYVHGMMDGEAVDPISKHTKVQWFKLR